MWGEPAELSTLFEHECADAHATQSTVSSHCEGLVALVLNPLATNYVPTTYSTAYWEMALRTPSLNILKNETLYIANSSGIFTELRI